MLRGKFTIGCDGKHCVGDVGNIEGKWANFHGDPLKNLPNLLKLYTEAKDLIDDAVENGWHAQWNEENECTMWYCPRCAFVMGFTNKQSESIVTPENTPCHEIVGHLYQGPSYSKVGPQVFYCDSYDPSCGYWMTNIEDRMDRHNVSERAIDRTFHKLDRYFPAELGMLYGYTFPVNSDGRLIDPALKLLLSDGRRIIWISDEYSMIRVSDTLQGVVYVPINERTIFYRDRRKA